MKLFLASSSLRRAQVLRDAGIPFEIITVTVDESIRPEEHPEAMVIRLAEEKARAGAALARGDGIVLGADTSVTVDGEILGKPASLDDARRMLRKLSGRTHTVITGIFAVRLMDGASSGATETARVIFAPLDDEEIDAYVASGEPLDKAGAYGIQGRAGKFVVGIDGCFFNVMGLPLRSVYNLLRGLGWKDAPERREMKGSVG